MSWQYQAPGGYHAGGGGASGMDMQRAKHIATLRRLQKCVLVSHKLQPERVAEFVLIRLPRAGVPLYAGAVKSVRTSSKRNSKFKLRSSTRLQCVFFSQSVTKTSLTFRERSLTLRRLACQSPYRAAYDTRCGAIVLLPIRTHSNAV